MRNQNQRCSFFKKGMEIGSHPGFLLRIEKLERFIEQEKFFGRKEQGQQQHQLQLSVGELMQSFG